MLAPARQSLQIAALISSLCLGPTLTFAEIPRHVVRDAANTPFPYAARPEALGFSSKSLTSLGDQVEEWTELGDIVGAEILLIKEGQIAWHELIGWADLETQEALQPNTIFRIRSMTKPMLGTATLRLAQAGILDLEDRVAEYLPSFDHGAAGEITITQLLRHTSGLAPDIDAFSRDRSSYATLRESVDDVGRTGPKYPAGEFHYSDAGSSTLGAVLEAATGEPLESILQGEVFRPLDLDDTYVSFAPDSSWAHRVSSTHRLDPATGKHYRYWHRGLEQEMPYFRASGGVYSTVMDYAKFMQQWMRPNEEGDGDYLSRSLIERAMTPSEHMHYGMHWDVVSSEYGDPMIFGHGGSDGTLALAIPEEQAILLYFTQSRSRSCREQFAMLAGMTGELGLLDEWIEWGRWRELSPEIAPVDLSTERASKLAGYYDSHGDVVRVVSEGPRLRLVRGVGLPLAEDPRPDGRIVCGAYLSPPVRELDLIPISEDEFLLGEWDGTTASAVYWPEARLRFEFDDGEIAGYEIEYSVDVTERARRYQFQPRPRKKREPIPDELASRLAGRYEGRGWSVDIRPREDLIEIGSGPGIVDTLHHQGLGVFRASNGDVIFFGPDPEEGEWGFVVSESRGQTYSARRIGE